MKYIKCFNITVVFGLLLVSSALSARDLLGVPYINEVSYPDPTSCLVWVYGSSESGTKPVCDTLNNRMVFNMCTETGKVWLSIILTHVAQNKSMKIVGAGTCGLYPTTESVRYLRLNEGG